MQSGRAARWLLVIVGATGGCAASGEARSSFPTADELQKLAERPRPERLVRSMQQSVQGWALAGPLPVAVEQTPHAVTSSWDRLLAETDAARHGLVFLSEPMACTARELGRFFLVHRALPDEALGRFIAARCGNTVARVATMYWSGDLSDGAPADGAFDHWHPDVERGLAAALRGGQRVAGIWFGRQNGRAVVMLAHNLRQAELEPTPLVPGPDGRTRLRGELLVPAATVQAIVNRGRHGYSFCDVDSTALPRFAIECVVDPTDESTWLEVAAFPAGRVVGPVVVNLLLWPSGAIQDSYQHPASVAARPPSADVGTDILNLINEVRRAASLPLLELAPNESDRAALLAPHYFAAQAGFEEETVADQVVLGLRAGWGVGGRVRFGEFTASAVASLDVGDLVAAALERPSGRQAVLNPAVRKIAVGPVVAREEKLLAAVISTYAFADAVGGERERVLEHIGKARRQAGRNPAVVSQDLAEHAAAAARLVDTGELDPSAALEAVLAEAAYATARPVRGWWIAYTSLDHLKLPDPLVQAPALHLALAVARHRPRGEPWTRYVALCLIADEGTTFAAIARKRR